jgi:hypothetical protein
VCCNAREDNTIQRNTIQYNKFYHTSENTTLKATLYTQNYNNNNNNKITYTIKTQKLLEPKVVESVLIPTRYAKQ